MNFDPKTEARIAKLHDTITSLANEVESERRLTAELRKTEAIQSATIRELRAEVEAYRDAATARDINEDALRAENEALRADKERLEWFFGPQDKLPFVQTYLAGIAAGFTVDQWRTAIDAARAASQPPEGQT